MTKTCFRAFLIAFLLLTQNAIAQKRNNIWVFGSSAGLDFNTNAPSPITNTSSNGGRPPHYISSISDKKGGLLFYTDGFTVWNSAHEVVPKYLYRWPWSGYVMPLICPVPANDTLYYLFGVSRGSYANRLQYLTINMNDPKGAIVYPQPSTLDNFFTVLKQNAAVALAGTAHCNQKDNWIAVYADGAMHSFLVTKDGVATTPVVSSVAGALPNRLDVGHSNFKFSANGEKMVIPMPNEGQVVVLDFNNLTGTFSNPVTLKSPFNYILEDVELAADGSKLYMASYKVTNPTFNAETHFIYQMDLDAGTAAEIEKTTYAVGIGASVICSPRYCVSIMRTMQLGPDGKIYVSMRDVDETISVIQEPTRKGADAFYREDIVNLKKTYGVIGFNYIRSGSFDPKENGIQVQKQVCIGQPASFSLLFKQVDSVKWDFGDPGSSSNYATSFTPSHTYPGAGIYTVKAIIYKNCYTDTATALVEIQATKPVAIPDFIKDTVACKGGPLLLNAADPTATTYTWENGYKFSKREIKEAGRYEILMMNECSYDRRAFNVTFEECECEMFVPSAFTPNNDGLNDVFRPVVKCLAKEYSFKIFNRYGGTVYVSSALFSGWDGTIKKAPAPSGVYVWTLHYRNPNNNELISKQGTVVLVR